MDDESSHLRKLLSLEQEAAKKAELKISTCVHYLERLQKAAILTDAERILIDTALSMLRD